MVSTQLINSDCVVAMKEMADNSVDSIVTDPPYGLEFMGKEWDYDVPNKEMWKEALRVLKPGGYLLSFAGSRTYHRMVVNIEDAGFEIRDQIMWIYGSGFPKSHDISKAIDKAAGVERTEVVGTRHRNVKPFDDENGWNKNDTQGSYEYKAPATPEAKQWDGWGTALKPAHEPIVVARKPLIGTVVENVLEHGTGGLNLDGCRIGIEGGTSRIDGSNAGKERNKLHGGNFGVQDIGKGRFPANVILDEEAGAMLDEQSGDTSSTRIGNPKDAIKTTNNKLFGGGSQKKEATTHDYRDSGGASRFFYCAKPSQKERNAGCDHLPEKVYAPSNQAKAELKRGNKEFNAWDGKKHTERHNHNHVGSNRNHHPTVKPVDLMRYLCRLVTPPEGIVLDPFMGSGTTGVAANMEGFNFIGIEMDEEYIEIARARITHSGDYEIKEDLTMERIKQPTLMDFNA